MMNNFMNIENLKNKLDKYKIEDEKNKYIFRANFKYMISSSIFFIIIAAIAIHSLYKGISGTERLTFIKIIFIVILLGYVVVAVFLLLNFKIVIENNEILDVQNYFLINKETMYIDNPFILDSYDFEDENHQTHLATNVFSENENSVISEIKVKKKLNNIYQKLNSVLSGEILENKNSKFVYRKNGEDIDLKNLSTGLKTFAIIKMLLQNGTLEENGTIILDEPEIHLHPEWQLKFAELIVLLQKEFSMHILLTTHSPYFVSAIEVFSEKYKIDDKCKYYVAENKGNSGVIKDITGNTNIIFKKMARPFQDLENIRYTYDDE